MSDHTLREGGDESDGVPRTPARTVRDDALDQDARDAAPRSVLRLPTTLARDWHIVSELANWGAESDLLVVENASGERRVAKIYRARIEPKTEVLQRVGGTSFEHVVRLYAHGTSDGRCYELLEYIETGSLEDLIRAEGPRLEVTAVSDILWELTIAIEHLHEHRVVHRDIKPSNVLVRTRTPLDLVLTDFGIASVLDQASRRFTAAHRTIAYAAPETAAGEVPPASDWWSLGIILVEMLTGRHPFAAAHAGTLLDERVIMSRVAQMPVDDLVTGVDPPWRDLCRGLLRREARNRWGSEEIRRWIRRDPTLTVAPEQGPARYGLVPFFFADRRYESLPEIAAAFGANWQEARKSVERNHFFDWIKDELKDNEWRQFLNNLDRDCEDLDERVFRICAKLDPSATPVFSGSSLDTQGLTLLARAALSNGSDAETVLAALLHQRILRVAADVTGIAGYRELDDAWRREVRAFEEGRDAVAAAGGPSSRDAAYRHASAALLLAVLPAEGTPYADTLRAHANDAVNRDVREAGWFRALGSPLTASPAVAFLMRATAPFAEERGRAEREQREAASRVAVARVVGNSVVAVVGMIVLGGVIWAIAHAAATSAGAPAYRAPAHNVSTVTQPVTAVADASAVPALVNEYYRLWDRGDFGTMYGMLSARYRAQHPFGTWQRQHATVVRIGVRTAPTSDPMTVAVVIDSTDRTNAGTVDSEYRGTWTAVRESGSVKLDRVALNQIK